MCKAPTKVLKHFFKPGPEEVYKRNIHLEGEKDI